MTDSDSRRLEDRVLILAPTSKDAELTGSILGRAGVICVACGDLDELCDCLEAGAAALLIVEEAVQENHVRLTACLAAQPSWSDLPVLVLARPGADSAAVAEAMELLGNVTVLERPTRVAALVSAVRTALRARQRQYETRDYLLERAAAADRLIEANARLQEALTEIQATQAALREADRRKDEFLAVLAHELRNPLAPITSALHILRMTGQRDPAADRVAGIMQRQVNLMVRLVDDLLEVSRITRGKIDLRKEQVEMSAVVRSAVEISRPLIESSGHAVSLDVPADPVLVHGDPVRLAQVIANLLNNAAKYTEANGQIWLTVRRDEDWVTISVKDSGIGIAPELLPRVFDMFIQGERRDRRAQGGLGIGLALVKSLVEMHGGSVTVHSDGVGRGSEFVVRLPVATVRDGERRQGSPAELAMARAPRRVMVVDDNRDAAQSLGILLRLLGADVRVAYSGTEALAVLPECKPEIVLLDVGMPGMDGHEVATRIRQRPDCADVTLIALTGWGQESDRQRSHAAGFDYHLVKPCDIRTLESLLISAGRRREWEKMPAASVTTK